MENVLYLIDLDKKFTGHVECTIQRETEIVEYTEYNFREYLQAKKIKNYHLLEWDAFCEIYYKPFLNGMITEFKPITEQMYFNMLECMPPMKWHDINKQVNVFFICEALTQNLHSCLLRVKKNGLDFYYEATKSKFIKDSEILTELLTLQII